MDFKGKVVLITGASAGIGAETAVHFASLGASLSLSGRNGERLRNVADKCKNACSPEGPLVVIADLSKASDVHRLLNETIERYGRLDVLVNNAAITNYSNVEGLSLDVYDNILTTNVRAIVQLTKLALPYLIEGRGNVVNISSAVSMRPSPNGVAYRMSKSALDQFTKCLALEVGPKRVRVNSVNPGAVVTDMLLSVLSVDGQVSDAAMERTRRMHALGQLGETLDVARAIAFLASDLASNITGVLLPVDGGYSIMSPAS